MQDHAFIGRTPILDAKQQIVAYDLLFRHSATAAGAIEDDLKTSARALMNPAPDMGAQWPLSDKLVFIKVREELLQSEFLAMLNAQHTVLEIPVSGAPSEQTLQQLDDLRAQGFQIALDNFLPTAESVKYLPHAQFVKIDIETLGLDNAGKLAAKLKALAPKLIATRVETPEQFKACKQHGFHYFEGYFFTHYSASGTKIINPSYASVLDLLNKVNKKAEVKVLEDGFKRDPALSFKLLRYINSVGFGLSCEIQSIKHALIILGTQQLYRWLTLLMVTAGENTTAPGLMKTAIIRGRLTELLGADFFDQKNRDNLFIVGVFSLLDAMLEMPMDKVLDKVQLPEAITDALLRREGVYGPFLQLAEACESGNSLAIEQLASSLQYEPAKVNDCHIAALSWAESFVP